MSEDPERAIAKTYAVGDTLHCTPQIAAALRLHGFSPTVHKRQIYSHDYWEYGGEVKLTPDPKFDTIVLDAEDTAVLKAGALRLLSQNLKPFFLRPLTEDYITSEDNPLCVKLYVPEEPGPLKIENALKFFGIKSQYHSRGLLLWSRNYDGYQNRQDGALEKLYALLNWPLPESLQNLQGVEEPQRDLKPA